jgi:hypothetical protein
LKGQRYVITLKGQASDLIEQAKGQGRTASGYVTELLLRELEQPTGLVALNEPDMAEKEAYIMRMIEEFRDATGLMPDGEMLQDILKEYEALHP